jgi:hypothetical protein
VWHQSKLLGRLQQEQQLLLAGPQQIGLLALLRRLVLEQYRPTQEQMLWRA